MLLVKTRRLVEDWETFLTGVFERWSLRMVLRSARRRMVERGYVCMYPSSRRFRCDLDTFPVCRVVNRVIREDTRKDAMYIYTALNDEEDKKDLGGRTHTDDEGVYGHSMTRHDGRGRRLDFVPSVCKRRGSLTPAHPWVSPSLLSST